jgi:hypothetical protein
VHHEDDGKGPGMRTLAVFSLCLAMVIVAIIGGAALLGA